MCITANVYRWVFVKAVDSFIIVYQIRMNFVKMQLDLDFWDQLDAFSGLTGFVDFGLEISFFRNNLLNFCLEIWELQFFALMNMSNFLFMIPWRRHEMELFFMQLVLVWNEKLEEEMEMGKGKNRGMMLDNEVEQSGLFDLTCFASICCPFVFYWRLQMVVSG
ncbi:hypothetical protein SUGI_0795770 [Cryptomeria japonica]|nr:hypothetical protein SUGI_0795770 [Cryptomeria japonica]